MGNFVRTIKIYFDVVDKFARDGFMSQTNRKAAEEKKTESARRQTRRS